MQNTAQIFAHALLGVEGGTSSSQSSASSVANVRNPEPCPLISHLIQRRDLLDDNNAGKEKMTEAKKKLKVDVVLDDFLVSVILTSGRSSCGPENRRRDRISRGKSRSRKSLSRSSR